MNELDNIQAMTEDKLQSDCYLWFHESFPHLRGLMYHVPNGKNRSKATGAILKGMGVQKGIPDLVFHYRGKSYFIEMKNASGKGRLSPEQKKIHALLGVHNFEVWVCESFDYFKEIILTILARTETETERLLDRAQYFYRHDVFAFLYSLDGAQVVHIADACDPSSDRQPFFINCITDFIELGYGYRDGFEILFTSDYKAFYKKVINDDTEIKYIPVN